MAKTRDWYAPLRAFVSKGSRVDPGGLAGLAEARRQHQGQFFTPDAVVAFMWRLASLDVPDDRTRQKGLHLLDNSFGSGRMFQFADKDVHKLVGVEIDPDAAKAVQSAAKVHGFDYQLECGSLEAFRMNVRCVDVALINPPFSITIDSPFCEDLGVNAHGRFGTHSSVLSHRYAVAQALRWAKYVIAVVPTTFANACLETDGFSERLAGVFHLPRDAFSDEGAEVSTSIVAFGAKRRDGAPRVRKITDLNEVIRLDEVNANEVPWGYSSVALAHVQDESDKPRVTAPVTGDKRVRVVHNGRRIFLKYACGAVEGRVQNAVLNNIANAYRGKGDGRLPKTVKYSGDGKLDVECYLHQPDPPAAFRQFLDEIRAAGGEPDVDPGLLNYMARRARRMPVLREPFRHTVNLADGGFRRWLGKQTNVRAVAKQEFPVWDGMWSRQDVRVKVGDVLELAAGRDRDGKRRWAYTFANRVANMGDDTLIARCDFPDFVPLPNTWTVIHEGLKHRFPTEFAEVEHRARSLGLDQWCTWDYQFYDLCEVAMKRGNTIVGWTMGLGKARLALSLCKLNGGRRNLIVVEAHLVKEMITEVKKLGIPAPQWQVIDDAKKLKALKRFNIVSYSKLKSPVDWKRSKRITYSHALRRRVHTLITDEGHLLRNLDTDQSRAVLRVSPRNRYTMSGTPVANYPRDVLPLVQWAAGDGTANQRFGLHRPLMTDTNYRDVTMAVRGIDEFREMFVTLEWVTNEFAEDLRSGAKREIPRIKDVDKFREMMAPVLKRRVMEEPEVAKNVKIPKSVTRRVAVKWDDRHLAYYHSAAKEFINWFKQMSEYDKKQVGPIAILAKMQAVYTAANNPQEGVAGKPPYKGATSKQRLAVETLGKWTEDGHKTIFLTHSPAVCEYVGNMLDAEGLEYAMFHGGMSIADRIEVLDDRFRFGDCPILLATKGVLQTGYNIYQADRVLVYDRSWTPKVEQQACARVLRPQQTRKVEIEFLELAGSIDTYQAQMVEFKAESMKAGLDFGDDDPSREFVHIETILGRFVEEFEAGIGKKFDEFVKEKGGDDDA